MFSNRRKYIETNKVIYYNNAISTIFRPVQGKVPELVEPEFWSLNSTNDIYNTNINKVAIGMTTPFANLDVSGTFNASKKIMLNYVSIAPPIGSIVAYTVSTSPDGWLICDGSGVSRLVYASLFEVIGTTFGSGDGSGTFNLPNYQGAFLRGTGTNGVYSGPALNSSQNHATQTHTHAASSVVTDPGHTHTQTTINDDFNNSGANPPGFASDSAGSRTWSNISTSTTGITVATTIANSTTNVNVNETRPYNFGVYWIIKY
jgi:microcystin-dependent protein